MALNWLDLTIIGIITLSMVFSLIRGFIRESFSLASWVIAIWAGIAFTPTLSAMMPDYVENPLLRTGISFLIIFLTLLIIGSLISYLLSKLARKTGLSGTDRLLGLIFGAARGVLIVAVLLVIGVLMGLEQQPWWQSSTLITHFKPLTIWLQSMLPEQAAKEI